MTCSVCGCTDRQVCVYATTETRFRCFRVEPDLCSFCALGDPPEHRLQEARLGAPFDLAAVGEHRL